MPILHEFVYPFTGFHGTPSECHIRVLDGDDKPLVVICSQMAKSRGTSVTNAAEIIAQDVRKFLERDNVTLLGAMQNYVKTSQLTSILDDLVRKLKDAGDLTILSIESIKLALEYRERQLVQTGKIDGMVWVEHYAPGLGLSANGSYAIVTFAKDSWTPDWKYLSILELSKHTGHPEEDFEIPIAVLSRV